MSALLQKIPYSANDDLDTVVIRIGDLRERVGYNVGFSLDQYMRLAAKQAASIHGAPATFWRELYLVDLDDCPKAHRGIRQSRLTPSYDKWEVKCNPPLVGLYFDGSGVEVEYETAVQIGHAIRRASRRAKAWAGDTTRWTSFMGNLTAAA